MQHLTSWWLQTTNHTLHGLTLDVKWHFISDTTGEGVEFLWAPLIDIYELQLCRRGEYPLKWLKDNVYCCSSPLVMIMLKLMLDMWWCGLRVVLLWLLTATCIKTGRPQIAKRIHLTPLPKPRMRSPTLEDVFLVAAVLYAFSSFIFSLLVVLGSVLVIQYSCNKAYGSS